MVDQRLKALNGTGRRDFLRWSATVAACLGLERSRFLNVLSDTVGSAAADTAACATTNLMMGIVDGNGGLANHLLAFPIPKVIQSTNGGFSHYAIGKGTAAAGYDKPYVFGPDSPWQGPNNQPHPWKVSAFVAGTNETHTGTPNSVINLGTNSLYASAAAIMQANPTLLPVLTVGGVQFGNAPGAPAAAAVGAANQLVELFNSAASRALLKGEKSGGLAESYYKAFIALNSASNRSVNVKAYGVGKVSMNLLSKNLSSQLTPTAADEQLFGITGATPGAIANMGRAMITALKAMGLGLTSMMVQTGLRNDPHGLFAGGDAQAAAVGKALGAMYNGIYELAKTIPDPGCSSKTLASRMVVTVSGDTPKDPFNRNGWPDNTAQNHNLLYVMGNGYLKSGWFGDVAQGNTQGWDPSTGNTGGSYQGRGGALGQAASAATLFAIARGDQRRVSDFSTMANAIGGVINANGVPE